MITEKSYMSLIQHADFDVCPYKLWREEKTHTDIQHAYYIILRGVSKKNVDYKDTMRRLHEAFTPVKNQRKLLNGRKRFDTLRGVLWRIIFFDVKYLQVSDDQHKKVKDAANHLRQLIFYDL